MYNYINPSSLTNEEEKKEWSVITKLLKNNSFIHPLDLLISFFLLGKSMMLSWEEQTDPTLILNPNLASLSTGGFQTQSPHYKQFWGMHCLTFWTLYHLSLTIAHLIKVQMLLQMCTNTGKSHESSPEQVMLCFCSSMRYETNFVA